jgi:hypothetical protein
MTHLIQSFNYSALDDSTASFLRNKEGTMRDIVGKAYTELGKELKEAQDELSKRGYGCFYEWFESLGFKKDQVYRWIGRYELIVANCDKRELIEELPLSLTYEISKPSIEPDLKQKVLDGEIESLKELREIKKALQEAERRAAQAEATATTAQSSAHHFEKLFNSVKNQPPRIETKHVEVVPENLKRDLEQLKFENTNLRHGYQDAKEKLQQYELRNTVDFDAEEAQRERDKLQHEADLSTIQLRVTFKQFIEKAAITSFLQGAIATATPAEKERLAEMVEAAQQIIDQTKLALSGRRLGVVNG